MGGTGAGARGPFRISRGGLTQAKIKLAERLGQSPFPAGFGDLSAAQVMVLAAALREEAPAPAAGTPPKRDRPQPLSRAAMLALARQHDPGVRDMGE